MYYNTPSCPVCLAKVLQLPRSPYWGFASGLTPGPLQATLSKLCAQAKSASYPQRDGKWVVATAMGWRPSVWLIGAMVCLLAAPWVHLPVSAGNGWSLLTCCGTIDSCQLAANSEVVKALLDTRISVAITSALTFTFAFTSSPRPVTGLNPTLPPPLGTHTVILWPSGKAAMLIAFKH